MLGAVEHAAQDKVGRYEVPRRADIAVLKKIANPLKLGDHARGGVRAEPRMAGLADRKAAGADQVTVAQLRGGSGEEQPGLPEQCRTSSSPVTPSRRTRRGCAPGGRSSRPSSTRSPDDMVLRSQELPTQEEFDTASARAAGHLPHPASAGAHRRSVHALADAIRRNATGRLHSGQGPRRRAGPARGTLGLTDDAEPRMATSRALTALLGTSGRDHRRHETVRVLASRRLRRDNAFYQAHLDSAER